MADEHGNQVPWLLFARKHQVSSSHGYQVPQTSLARAADVAKVLADYHVENVVLNACLSAYNHTGPTTNLAHIFLESGIQNVSAMWFYVHWQTVATYLDAFYNELLIKGTDFHLAAQRGRDAIQQNPTSRTGRPYQDFFLCVNYSRDIRRPGAIQREPSPTPSAHSAGSSTSNASMKSFMSGVWRPSTPRLSDSFLIGDEPIMRLKLHLLELEYKLMTFRVVYASDLRRAGSDLHATIEKMVGMWLNTNLIDDVFYYKAKDFAKRKLLTDTVSYREKRTRASNGGYLQLLFPRPVRALRQTLHIIRDVDSVVDPGWQADDVDNQRSEERRFQVQEGLQRFAQRLHKEGHSYLLFIGSQDAQWWRTYLQHLNGEWWLHMPWNFTVHSRYTRDVKLRAEKRKQNPRTTG
ncbi:tpr repeat-containing [Trichoderma arundinaceum]|uniref:Tpr repeat-containing n=1 Tax=Trichoderma arundinaceum TaxID=490622 RepID=A0A395NB93_TRIAR|nr:tpr repeat-containing [Trichoderma arundinaceum]